MVIDCIKIPRAIWPKLRESFLMTVSSRAGVSGGADTLYLNCECD